MSSEKSSASRHNLFFAQKSFPISNKATELDILSSTGNFPFGGAQTNMLLKSVRK